MDSDHDPFPFAHENLDAAGERENLFGTNTMNYIYV